MRGGVLEAMRGNINILGAIVFSLLIAISACAQDQVYNLSDVQSRSELRGKEVRMKACLYGDRHGVILIDCSDDSVGMAFDLTEVERDSPKSVAQFVEMSYIVMVPDPKAGVTVLVSGVYVGSGEGRASNIFVVKRVEKIEAVAL